MSEQDQGPMTIGEMASDVGVSAQTLRLWEEESLVTPQRTPGGQRRYHGQEIERVRQIAAMRRRQGWNVAAIRTSLTEGGNGSPHVSLPQRLRRARRAAGFSQREVATRIGVGLDQLRAVERGEQEPTIQMISQFANVYLLPMSAFATPARGGGRVVAADQRPRTSNEGGVTWEELCRPGQSLEPAILVVPPGQDSGGTYLRRGTVFAFVLAGKLGVAVGDPEEEYALGKGDAITIESGDPFRWWNAGRREARLLWVEDLAPDAWRTGAAENLLQNGK